MVLAAAVSACQAEQEAGPELKLARKVVQVLDDPASMPLAGAATVADAVAPAVTATPADAAAPAVAAPTAVPATATTAVAEAGPAVVVAAGAVAGAPVPAAVAEPAPTAGPAKVDSAGASDPAQTDPAKTEKATADKAKADLAERADKAKADKTERADKAKADKAEKAQLAEAAKTKSDDVVVPEGADATDLFTSGKRKLAAGDYAGAIGDLRASNKLRYSVRTLTTLGRAYFDAGQMAQAEKAFKAAGTFDEAMLLLAQLYQQTGKPGQARKVYEQFLAVHADHPKAEWARKMIQAL